MAVQAKIAIVFLVSLFIFNQVSSINPVARFVQSAAMCESFPSLDYSINGLEGETIDWARNTQGNYYSNKAPGPAFISLPIFCPLLAVLKNVHKIPQGFAQSCPPLEQSLFALKKSYYLFDILLSVIFQGLAFVFLAKLFLRSQIFRSSNSQHNFLGLFAMYFGTGATVFANVWFGHSLAAAFTAISVLLLFEKSFFLAAFFIGFAALSDYAVIFMFPGLALLLFAAPFTKKGILQFCCGIFLPVFLWMHYHTQSFGGPFELPQKYNNPQFLDVAPDTSQLWQVIRIFPRLDILWKLLFGPERGLLVTQPWILFLVFALPFTIFYSFQKTSKTNANKRTQIVRISFFISFLGLLWMNASFGGWHGGASSGPRYLIPGLLLFPLLLPKFLEQFSSQHHRVNKILSTVLIATLGLTFFINAFIKATFLLAPSQPLWPFLMKYASEHQGTFYVRMSLCILMALYFWRLAKKTSRLA